jgi:type I restriction enzyme S subunit
MVFFINKKNNLIESCFRGSGVKHPSMPEILQIPVPPLKIQKEIVNILNKFTKLEAQKSNTNIIATNS